MFKIVSFLVLGVLFCPKGVTGEPAVFTRKPATVRDGRIVKISFAVSSSTDVAVCIEDAKGKVIRHLAAGVLGPNPPPPFKAGLAQEILWDGMADYGKSAVGGPFKVRVALGLGAKCDRIFNRPEKFSGGLTLGIGPDGALYVREIATQVTAFPKRRLAVLNRDGSYRRTLLPFAATFGGDAGKGVPRIVPKLSPLEPLLPTGVTIDRQPGIRPRIRSSQPLKCPHDHPNPVAVPAPRRHLEPEAGAGDRVLNH